MSKYTLHWRGAEHYFVLIDCILDPKYYGKFDYRALVSKNTDAVFLTKKGVQDQYKFGKQLLDDNFLKDLVENINRFILDMEDTVILNVLNKKEDLTDKEIIRVWNKIYENIRSFSNYYLYAEHPVLAYLDEIIFKACGKDRDLLIGVFNSSKLAETLNFSIIEKKALAVSLEMGNLKLKMHTKFESWLKALVDISKILGKKYNLSSNQVLCMRHEELDKLVRFKNIISTKILNDRYNGSVFICQTGSNTECLTGKNYKIWKNRLEGSLSNHISGVPVYPGKARGSVKLHMEWMGTTNIPENSILVTGMTNPQIIPLIKNVKAIITDEGGLTCHAAIISRELKIPCIVGCQNATQIFKDGDMVEVDANKGIVKKL